MTDASELDRLDPESARILALESAAITGHTFKVAITEPGQSGEPIALEELRRRVRGRIEHEPRLRQRVELSPPDGGGPAWVDDPDFDVSNHVGQAEIGSGVDRERFLEIAAEVMADRLDHARPLWRMDVVPLQGGGTGLLIRIHHCLADGVSSVRLVQAILWDEGPAKAPSPPPRLGQGPETESGEGRRHHPGRAVRSMAAVPGALARELRPSRRSSPLDRRIGREREIAVVARPLEELKRIEHGFGKRLGTHVTINDVLLAGVAGGVRRWLGEEHLEAGRMRVQVPVSMHHRSEHADELGNRDSFMFIDLPVTESDPARRLELINAETVERKRRGDADALYHFFHGLSHLSPVYNEAMRLAAGPREFSLAVSNVPGPREPVHLLGRRVAELYSMAEPAERHALRVSAISCGGEMGFGMCTDPTALEGLEHLAGGLESSLDELGERA
jgi:diacylglycerol O-acyltransferase